MLVYWVSHSPLKHWYLGLNTPFLDKFTTCAWVWVPSTWYSAVHTKIAGKSMVHPPKWTKKHKCWIVLAHPQWKCFSVSGRHVPSCSSPSLGGKVSSIFQVEDIPKIMEPLGKCPGNPNPLTRPHLRRWFNSAAKEHLLGVHQLAMSQAPGIDDFQQFIPTIQFQLFIPDFNNFGWNDDVHQR